MADEVAFPDVGAGLGNETEFRPVPLFLRRKLEFAKRLDKKRRQF